VKTLNETSFHMGRMVIFEVEISASVGGFSINLSGHCRPFPDDQNIQKGMALSDSISIVNRSSFRNVVFSNFLEYWTMDEVQKLSNSECCTPSSEPIRIYMPSFVLLTIQPYFGVRIIMSVQHLQFLFHLLLPLPIIHSCTDLSVEMVHYNPFFFVANSWTFDGLKVLSMRSNNTLKTEFLLNNT
jgi:hypothetical protein